MEQINYREFAIALLKSMKFSNYNSRTRIITEDDITTVVTTLLWAKLKFNGTGKLRPFMAMCGKRKIQHMIKQRRRIRQIKLQPMSSINPEKLTQNSYSFTNTKYTVMDDVENTEVLNFIKSPDNVGKRTAQIIDLFLDGLSIREIGRKINVSPQTVVNRLNRAAEITRKRFS